MNDDNEIMMITTEGIIIRTAVDSISILGRNTSGVKVMNVGENVEVASIAKVREEKLEDEMEKIQQKNKNKNQGVDELSMS